MADGSQGESEGVSMLVAHPGYGSTTGDVESADVAKLTGQEDPVVSTVDAIPNACREDFADAPVVGIAAKVISISDLNMAGNTFLADFNVNVAWVGGAEDGPEIQLYNMVTEIEREQVPVPQSDGKGNGKCVCKGKKGSHDGQTQWSYYYRVRVRGIFRQGYKLESFPFDMQELHVDLRLKSKCRLVPLHWSPNGEACACDPRAVMDEFILVGAGVDSRYLPSYKFGRLDGYDPEATLVFQVLRKSTFWVVSYGLVASMVCSLVACVYAIPIDNIGERLGVAMTLVLTMTATKYLMVEKLPTVSYLTLLDIHIIFCCLLLMGLTVQISLTTLVGTRRMEAIEEWFLPAVTIIWLGYHLLVLLWICMRSMPAVRFGHKTRTT